MNVIGYQKGRQRQEESLCPRREKWWIVLQIQSNCAGPLFLLYRAIVFDEKIVKGTLSEYFDNGLVVVVVLFLDKANENSQKPLLFGQNNAIDHFCRVLFKGVHLCTRTDQLDSATGRLSKNRDICE
jgi:hypothetical protein